MVSSTDTEANYKISQEIININTPINACDEDEEAAHSLAAVLCAGHIFVFSYLPPRDGIIIISDVYSIPGGSFIWGRTVSI